MPSPGTSFAFQPIADVESSGVFAYEALIRGVGGESADEVFRTVAPEALHAFDHAARIEAVSLAGRLGCTSRISLNLLPGTLESIPYSLDDLLKAAAHSGLQSQQLLLEVTEAEVIRRPKDLAQRLDRYRAHGVLLAIDDFGAGFSGLNLLADFQPDLIKLDMHLVRDIDQAGPRQAIARGVLQVCDDLGIEVIAEGVESVAEFRWFKRIGVRLFQGYLLGRPAFEALNPPRVPDALASIVA